ncbi:hypothetical protein D9756_003829 [Leucocoprinus leucothites]|uniref:Pre-rRNA-processing protein n=1 Tax=Leucocoprinus leucothites TaxID=201217 RepID=A0A8H5DB09_9AGAR|nr:hypothetical protein D9756_003829 [Leucoagaricus leucothites]
MPKSAKKRKDKAADFAKAKLKLGKEKKAPSNVIDTSFKARSIALPTQSIAVNKDENTPTTRRKLTFDDLLSQLKHYSPSVKKEALLGLTELLEAHWSLVRHNLSQLINQLARNIGDEDAGVRKQLLTFFSWMLPRIPKEDLIPHASTLVLFTASAQTHIFPELRIDAVRFLVLFLEYIPEPLVEGWASAGSSHGKRILEGYLGNLNAGTKYGGSEGPAMATSTSGVILSPLSRLAVLQSFSAFLQAGLSMEQSRNTPKDPERPLHAWFMSTSFQTSTAFEDFENLLVSSSALVSDSTQRSCEWEISEEPPQNYQLLDVDVPWTTQEIDDVVTNSGSLSEGGSPESSLSTFLSHLSRTLHPLLISTILDCAPSVFAPDAKGSETEASTTLAVSRIASLLYGTILGGAEAAPEQSLSELEVLLGYMVPYFPFVSSKSRDMKLVQSFQDLNLIYCELTSLLVLRLNIASTKSGRSLKPSSTLTMQVSAVSDYITKLLRGQNMSISQIPHSLQAGAYLGLLPSVWAIMNNPYIELSSHTADVLSALLDHANKTSPKSSTKRITIEFVARLLLLETEVQYRGTFRAGRSDQARQQFESWIINLPQTLWETGNSDPMTTEVILRFLLRLLQRRSSLVQPQVISALVLRLVPYFSFNHPVRGQLPGPYCKISSKRVRLRRLCLDVVAALLNYGGRCGTDISEACSGLLETVESAVAETVEEEYWTHVYMGVSRH